MFALAVLGGTGIWAAQRLGPDLLVRTLWSGSSTVRLEGGGAGVSESVPLLPPLSGFRTQHFAWQYQGQSYTLDTPWYTSALDFYRSLPTGLPLASGALENGAWWSEVNTLFLTPAQGDTSLSSVAQSLADLGRERDLTEDQLVELVTAFVQNIPYDQDKTDRRAAGQSGAAEKTLYPYEVLSEKKGVCQDKSYLAYRLLQELGYGVAIFLFPDPKDNHMAVAVACPASSDTYDSGYCFVETTSPGNKIGIIPELVPESRVATALIPIEDTQADQASEDYQPLGRVEVLNMTPGKMYTATAETIKKRDELARMQETIHRLKRELDQKKAAILSEEQVISQYDSRLAKLKRAKDSAGYNELVKPYNQAVDRLAAHVSAYNRLASESNALIRRYNTESQLFYTP